MGLTKPRAAQIFNLDYKQATRVVTVANITLSGGAPAVVDGVTLVEDDRVLVTAQSTGTQNGLYIVSAVGTGSNGTWARTSDGNETGEIEAGMIVMVTEGTVYADTQWKLITDNPIVIGTTTLTFTQNYSANSISGGTSNVAVYSNANVTISSAGTANVLTISSTGVVVAGTANVTGNITGNYILGNGSQLSGIITTVDANTLTGNTLSSNVVTSSLTSVGTLGALTVTANTTSGNLLTGGLISATGNITSGNANIIGTTASTSKTTGALKVAGGVGVAGDVYAGNSVVVDGGAYGNVTTTAFASVWGSGAGPNPYSIMQVRASDGVSGIGMQAYTGSGTLYGNTNIIFALGQVRDKDVPASLVTKAYIDSTGFSVTGIVSATGNVTGGNVSGTNLTGTLATASQTNITSVGTLTSVSVSGNTTSGNILTGGLISATGNVTGNYFIGNGSQLTGVIASSGAGNLWVVGRIATFYVPIISGILNIIGRAGNISVAINS